MLFEGGISRGHIDKLIVLYYNYEMQEYAL